MVVFNTFSRKIKKLQDQHQALSYEQLISKRKMHSFKRLQSFLAIIIVIFLSIYAAAQLKSGGIALNAILNWPTYVGVLISSAIVLFYCWSGGLRATIWTDAIQSLIMIISSVALAISALIYIGDWNTFQSSLDQISNNYFVIFPQNLINGGMTGFLLFLLGWLVSGFCVLGQPHVMVRVMILNDAKNLNKMMFYYYFSSILLAISLFFVSLSAKIILDIPSNDFNPEMALPMLAQKIMPVWFVGVIVSGIFSATMSTTDSLIISCSAAIHQSLLPRAKTSFRFGKNITIVLVVVATLIALFAQSNIFNLVLFSWSGLGISLGAAALLKIYGFSIKESTSIIIVVLSAGTTVLWKIFASGTGVPEALPGFLVLILSLLVLKFSSFKDKPKKYIS